MAKFSESWMDELLRKNDIVSVVSDYVLLSQAGRNMKGLCPFHNEKTPSFSVSPEKNVYHCFGCKAGGGVIQFIMDIEKLQYYEAVEFLARRVSMEIPQDVDDEKLKLERAKKERLYNICKEAALFFHKQLLTPDGENARQYLKKRLVNARTATRFGLGYAPDTWDALSNHLLEKGYKEQDIVDCNLAYFKKSGKGIIDAYRNKVIFPIISVTGRILAFGARTMDPNERPKYKNSSETPIYSKGNNLYALNLAKTDKLSDIIMVEGYMDVIRLHQSGITNAVASLGTALTVNQARLIKRFVDTVYIAYDGDFAGQNATLKSLDILAAEGLTVRIITIPNGLDPDDFVSANGGEAFLQLKDNAASLNEFKLKFIASASDLKTDNGREEFAKKACSFVATLPPVERPRFCRYIAKRTGLSVESVTAQCELSVSDGKNIIPTKRNNINKKPRSPRKETSERQRLEQIILFCALKSSSCRSTVKNTPLYKGSKLFTSPIFSKCFEKAVSEEVGGGDLNIAVFMAGLTNEEAELISPISGFDFENCETVLNECLDNLRKLDIQSELKQLTEAINTANADERPKLICQYQSLLAKLNTKAN